MKLPLNEKITINHVTYRGGDEVPGVDKAVEEKPKKKKTVKKEIINDSQMEGVDDGRESE